MRKPCRNQPATCPYNRHKVPKVNSSNHPLGPIGYFLYLYVSFPSPKLIRTPAREAALQGRTPKKYIWSCAYAMAFATARLGNRASGIAGTLDTGAIFWYGGICFIGRGALDTSDITAMHGGSKWQKTIKTFYHH